MAHAAESPYLQSALLGTLRDRELSAAGNAPHPQDKMGLAYRPLRDRERTSGVYRGSVQLASGRFAMLDDGMGFSLVPWRPVVEQRLGQSVTAVKSGSNLSWELGQPRGPAIS
jgi:hypothetical protein